MNINEMIKRLAVIFGILLSVPFAMAQTSGGSQTVTGSLDSRDYTLTVAPTHGTPVPSVGTHATYCWQSSVSCSVNATVQEGGATWNNTGWTGTGSVPVTGSSHITPTFVLTQVASSITWLWQQEVTYTLAVTNGTGDGTYSAGERVTITADAPPTGKEFAAWTGNTTCVADASAPTTTVTMPAANVVVTATYRDVVAPDPFGAPVVYPTLPMRILATVTLFGEAASGDDVLAVYCGDELRGKTKIEVIGGVAVANVSVYTPSDDELLTFTVWDASEEQAYESSASTRSLVGGSLGSYPSDLFPVPVNADPFGPVTVYPTLPMRIMASVELFDVPAEDGDVVAVYCDGELRGRAEVVVIEGVAVVNLSVFTAQDGEELEFQVWDASGDEVFASNFSKAASEVGGTLGSYPDDLFEIIVSDDIELAMDLLSGWSQVSFNIQLDNAAPEAVFASILPAIEQVVSTDHGTFDPTLPPVLNSLKSLRTGKGYWIKMKSRESLVSRGAPVALESTPVSVGAGWNHIGYLPNVGGSIRQILSAPLAQGKIERITGLDGVFDPASPDVFNSMTSMHPGRGYWLKAKSAFTFTYEAPASAIAAMVWSSTDPFGNPVAYPNPQMAVVGKVTLDGQPVPAGDVIAAHVGGELRAKALTFIYEGEAYVMLSVQVKQNGEEVTFRLWNKPTDQVFDFPAGATTSAGGAPFTFNNPLAMDAVGGGTLSFESWLSAEGIPPELRGYADCPAGDGIPNLLKYAFGLRGTVADSTRYKPGGTTPGLPHIGMENGISEMVIEFLRRRNSTLVYVPEQSTSLGTTTPWETLTEEPNIETVDATWERVRYATPITPATPRIFFRVRTVQP